MTTVTESESNEARGVRQFRAFQEELRAAPTTLLRLLGDLFFGLHRVKDTNARDALIAAFAKDIGGVLKSRRDQAAATSKAKPAELAPAAESTDVDETEPLDAALERALGKVLGPARSSKPA